MTGKELAALAAARLEPLLKNIDLNRERKEVSTGFRDDDKVYVARVTWKKVRYGGKDTIHFSLEVFSLDPQQTTKVPLERILPGGLGKKRPISLPSLILEASHNFKQ